MFPCLKIIFGKANSKMEVVIILMLASISVAGIFLAAFLWSIKDKQYEDEFSPSIRILFDDNPPSKEKTTEDINQNTETGPYAGRKVLL